MAVERSERQMPVELQPLIGAATDTGAVREENEDRVLVDLAAIPEDAQESNGILIAIADGMGGYQRGEVASRIAVETLTELYYEQPVGATEIPERLRRAFRAANDRIFKDGSAEGEQNMMGTTLVAAVVRGRDLTVANVGDSRAYLVRANRLQQVTRDHSLVAEQVAAGAMTEEEARESTHRNIITRALGHRPRVDVDIFEIQLLPEDRLILSTDGLHDYVEETEVVETTLAMPPEDAARRLVQLALEHGSNDNVSAVVARVAPAAALMEAEAAEPQTGGHGSAVVLLVLIGLVIFVAVVALLYFSVKP